MKPVSRIVFNLFRGTPQHDSWMVACLEGAWPRLVGEQISRACAPFRFSGRELRIKILDPAWDPTLRQMRVELLRKLREATEGEVDRLSFSSPEGVSADRANPR